MFADHPGPDFLRLLEKLLNIYGVHGHVTLLIGDACEKRLAAKAGRQGVRKHVTLMDLKTILAAYKEGQEKRKAREAADSDTESVVDNEDDEEDAQDQDATNVGDIEDGGVSLNESKRDDGAIYQDVSVCLFGNQETMLTVQDATTKRKKTDATIFEGDDRPTTTTLEDSETGLATKFGAVSFFPE